MFIEELSFYTCSSAKWREEIVAEESENINNQSSLFILPGYNEPLQSHENPQEALE
jgi:hypothetical protein